MTHPRKLIRDAAKGILEAAAIVAPDNVYTNRVRPFSGTPRPFLAVFTGSERIDVFNVAPRQHRRILDLVVLAVVDGNEDDLDDMADDLNGKVEDALHVDHTVGGYANNIDIVDVNMSSDVDGDRLIMASIMTFEVEYFTEVDIEATDPLERVHNDWEARHAPPASETTEIPQ